MEQTASIWLCCVIIERIKFGTGVNNGLCIFHSQRSRIASDWSTQNKYHMEHMLFRTGTRVMRMFCAVRLNAFALMWCWNIQHCSCWWCDSRWLLPLVRIRTLPSPFACSFRQIVSHPGHSIYMEMREANNTRRHAIRRGVVWCGICGWIKHNAHEWWNSECGMIYLHFSRSARTAALDWYQFGFICFEMYTQSLLTYFECI